MYLSKLEIFGFKSFANKTEIRFNEGLTCIVGPNGCGKTNVVDALRWVLGEQRTSTLRSDKMENVIFNGTNTRKPLGMSEVSLTIQNNRNILPIEYSEVTITRRIFRSGESEYLLNKNICRLKDITNLFMDTGMAANAYSVIELKMVEDILSNRQDGRRILFEEAAGVNKYKHRRKAALTKLESIQLDLNRVTDIHSEVQKKVNSLERQSRKTEQYNVFYQELRELEINLSERKLFNYKSRLKESASEIERLVNEKNTLSVEIEELQREKNKYNEQLINYEKELDDLRKEITAKIENIHSIKEKTISLKEKNNSSNSNINRYLTENESSRKKNEELSLQIENLKNNKVELDARIIDLQNKIDEISKSISEIEEKVKEKKEENKTRQNDLLNYREKYNQVKTNFEKLIIRLQNNKESLVKLDTKLNEENKSSEKATQIINELLKELYSVQNRIKDTEQELVENQNKKESLEEKIASLQNQELEAKNLLNKINAKIEFIQNLIDNLEGFSKGTKELLNRTEWHTGEKILVVDAGSVDEKLKIAIDSLLKTYFSHILLENSDDVYKGIKLIKENKLGYAAFHLANSQNKKRNLLERINSFAKNRIRRKVESESGFLGWASDLIECSAKWKKFFEIIIGNVCVVKNTEHAINIVNKYKDIDCLTIDGDIYRSNNIFEIGSEKSIADTAFGRKKVLSELNDIQTKETFNLEKILVEKSDTLAQLENINIKSINEKIKVLSTDQSNIEKQILQFEYQKKKSLDEIEKINTEIVNLKKINEDLESKKNAINKEVEENKNIIDKKDEEFKIFAEAQNELENQYDNARQEENNLRLELTQQKSEVVNIENILERSVREIDENENLIKQKKSEIEQIRNNIQEYTKSIDDDNLIEKALEDERVVLNDRLKIILEEYNKLRLIVNEIDIQLLEKREIFNKNSEKIYQEELTVHDCNLQSENLIARIEEEYQLKLFERPFDNTKEYDFNAVEKRIYELRNRIKSLGPINSLAFSEYEEEKQRLEFLTGQRNDLVEAEKELFRLIDEINETAKNLFLETFEKIRFNFIETFRGLFNEGDEADLKLEEGVDPLEAKIEIIAKPKGKRPTSIDLLSGGEKTLTAIALLFSIYLVKPSPFCILDEVDAPLDDANIDRFIKIINKFSENTQFIIVTHNKLTMEAANTLYGITMEEEGISKLVAVKFNEEIKVA